MKELNGNTDEEAFRVARLIAGYIRESLTSLEHDELDAWIAASDKNMELFEELTDEKNIEESLQKIEKMAADQALKEISERIEFNPPKTSGKVLRFWWYAVAASLILIAGGWIYFKFISGEKITKNKNNITLKQNDVNPGYKRAVLVRNNGERINLEALKDSSFQEGPNTRVNKKSGILSYVNDSITPETISFNTLITPRGGEYELVLADGSKVWMNAASSLKYPTSFQNGQRIVDLTGEAYFEIAKNPSKPFRVRINNGAVVEVLGTRFNVMSYTDELNIETTLLEGIVKLTKGIVSRVLKPGELAALDRRGEIRIDDAADIEEITAWKNGMFDFKDQEIAPIMRQVERWYDVEVVYEGNIGDHFNASIPRDVPVSKLLHLLGLTNTIHFKIEGRKIKVMP